jgi:hypothetical protein
MPPETLCQKIGDHILRGTLYAAQSKPLDAEGTPLPHAITKVCERCRTPLVTYKYSRLECEEEQGGHVIKPRVWPPQRRPGEREDTPATTSDQCIHCGVWCVVSEAHHDGVNIVEAPETKTEPKKAAAR